MCPGLESPAGIVIGVVEPCTTLIGFIVPVPPLALKDTVQTGPTVTLKVNFGDNSRPGATVMERSAVYVVEVAPERPRLGSIVKLAFVSFAKLEGREEIVNIIGVGGSKAKPKDTVDKTP